MGESDQSSEHKAVELASRFYEVLLRYVPPSTTLGELVVLTEVAKGVYRERPVTVNEIVQNTGISRRSVSRIVLRYLENGMIREKKDPHDSRKNLLVWTEVTFEGNRLWSQEWMRVWTAMER